MSVSSSRLFSYTNDYQQPLKTSSPSEHLLLPKRFLVQGVTGLDVAAVWGTPYQCPRNPDGKTVLWLTYCFPQGCLEITSLFCHHRVRTYKVKDLLFNYFMSIANFRQIKATH